VTLNAAGAARKPLIGAKATAFTGHLYVISITFLGRFENRQECGI
jgi:hypothetical protein